MKWVRRILLAVAILVVVTALGFGGRLFFLGKKSQESPTSQLGVEAGHLKACGEKPNCVSSQAEPNSSFYIEPIRGSNIEVLWDNLHMLLKEMGYKEESATANYLHYTDTSKIFKFVDDIEFLLQKDEGVIELRSRSRVGYSDMGVNRKRLEKIKTLLQPKL